MNILGHKIKRIKKVENTINW